MIDARLTLPTARSISMRSCRIVSLAAVVLIAAAVTPPPSARAESPQFAVPTSPPVSIDTAVPSLPSFDSLALMRVELRAIDSVQHVASFVVASQAERVVQVDTLSVAEHSRLEPRTSANARHARQRAHSSHLLDASNRLRLHRARSFHPLTL